jgi:hypothetical protein
MRWFDLLVKAPKLPFKKPNNTLDGWGKGASVIGHNDHSFITRFGDVDDSQLEEKLDQLSQYASMAYLGEKQDEASELYYVLINNYINSSMWGHKGRPPSGHESMKYGRRMQGNEFANRKRRLKMLDLAKKHAGLIGTTSSEIERYLEKLYGSNPKEEEKLKEVDLTSGPEEVPAQGKGQEPKPTGVKGMHEKYFGLKREYALAQEAFKNGRGPNPGTFEFFKKKKKDPNYTDTENLPLPYRDAEQINQDNQEYAENRKRIDAEEEKRRMMTKPGFAGEKLREIESQIGSAPQGNTREERLEDLRRKRLASQGVAKMIKKDLNIYAKEKIAEAEHELKIAEKENDNTLKVLAKKRLKYWKDILQTKE